MAEGLLRRLAGDQFWVYSAGTEATSVRPEGILTMAEVGADISGQESEMLGRYLGETFEYVITVCGAANKACQIFPEVRAACTGLSRTLRGPPEQKRNV